MENEVARCIAEGMAEMALNAIEKKLKLAGEDFSEDEERAGLGKPIVIGCHTLTAPAAHRQADRDTQGEVRDRVANTD